MVIIGPGAAASLTPGNDVAYDGRFAIGGQLSTSANFTLTSGNTSFLVSGTGAHLTDSGAFALDGLFLQASNHGLLPVGGLTLAPNSFVSVDDTGSLEVGSADGAAAGAVTIDAGATTSGTATITGLVVDDGTLIATGGTLTLQDDVPRSRRRSASPA
jgi:hypothetical protein